MKLPEPITFDAVVAGETIQVTLAEGTEITDCPCDGCKAVRALVLSRYDLEGLADWPEAEGV